MIKKELLDILACPKCKGPVESDAQQNNLVCRNCKLAYPVKADIPIMLIDEATSLEEEN